MKPVSCSFQVFGVSSDLVPGSDVALLKGIRRACGPSVLACRQALPGNLPKAENI